MHTLTPQQTDEVHGARAVDSGLTRLLFELMTRRPASVQAPPRDLIDF